MAGWPPKPFGVSGRFVVPPATGLGRVGRPGEEREEVVYVVSVEERVATSGSLA